MKQYSFDVRVMLSSAQKQPIPMPGRIWQQYLDNVYDHEFVDGEILAMTGGTIAHNGIAINLLLTLRPYVQKSGCHINMADVKVQAKRGDRYFYPDLVISCHPDDLNATQYIQHPQIIIEVLSPGTANYDRSQKLRYYRQIASLQQYLLINTDQMLVESYQRQTAAMWGYCDHSSENNLYIPSLEFEIAVSSIYENVTLEPAI
jgi:Uma2 family endonuclease